MASKRTASDEQLAALLTRARKALHLSTAFVTRMDGTTQHLEVVESSIPLFFKEGATQKQDTTFCQAIDEGRLPAVMSNVKDYPEAMKLPAARIPRIRSYVSVPIIMSDGTKYGTFCAAGLTSDKELSERDRHLMDVLAEAAAVIIEPNVREQNRRDGIEQQLGPLLTNRNLDVHLQPIVDLAGGQRIGAEALSRFPAAWEMSPDRVFAQAHTVGLGHRLEILALENAAAHLTEVSGYVAMNVSPATLQTTECQQLFTSLPLDRIVLELSEHDPVEDYDSLIAVLRPLRRGGLRLAIDDVGAGFSSLRHIVLLAPDVIKLDRTLVHGVSQDSVLHTLVESLVSFAHGSDAQVVAEGVETPQDALVLKDLSVDFGQGWYFGRPGPVQWLRSPAAVPTAAGVAPIVR